MDEDVLAVMRRQHGVVTRVQALGLGMTRRQVTERVRSGDWVPLARGVYRHAAVRPSWRATLVAAAAAFGAVVSHRSAAALHQIAGYGPGPREMLVARGRARVVGRSLPGVVLHETTQIDRIDLTLLDGIPCTGLARTVLDLAAVVSRRRLESTIDAVIRDRMLEWPDLYGVLVRHSRRGRDETIPDAGTGSPSSAGPSSTSHGTTTSTIPTGSVTPSSLPMRNCCDFGTCEVLNPQQFRSEL